MSEKRNHEILLELLGPAAPPSEASHETLPSIERRIEIFLHALHGDREFTATERSLARERILDEMTSDLLDCLSERTDQDVAVDTAEVSANTRLERATSSNSARAGSAGALKSLLETVMHDLLYPFFHGARRDSRQLRLIAVPLVALLVVGGGWTAAWFNAARSVEERFAVAAGNGRQDVSYACASQRTRGFPFRVELHCREPAATVVTRTGTYVIQAKKLVASAAVISPDSLKGEITGPVTVAEGGRPIAFADGDLGFDHHGNLAGTVKFTTTPGDFERLAAALGGAGDGGSDRMAQLASTYLRRIDANDNASPAQDEPDFGGRSVVDAPVNVIDGTISIGSVLVGRLPSLFGSENPKPGSKQ